MKKSHVLCLIFFFFLPFIFSCGSVEKERVILGDEQAEIYLPLLQKKRVALFSNHTGIVGDKIILADGSVHYGGNDLYGLNDESSLIHFGFDSSGN
ncbi:hypothetical protein, partial [uncultured Treponema sp.]|uniref:hypothetical protein n=1 Tax=uncultured Treponema sp. TaxID=162155 RepID=UPI0025EF39C5